MYFSCSCKFLRALCYIAVCHVCLINTQTTILSKCNIQYKPEGKVGGIAGKMGSKLALSFLKWWVVFLLLFDSEKLMCIIFEIWSRQVSAEDVSQLFFYKAGQWVRGGTEKKYSLKCYSVALNRFELQKEQQPEWFLKRSYHNPLLKNVIISISALPLRQKK